MTSLDDPRGTDAAAAPRPEVEALAPGAAPPPPLPGRVRRHAAPWLELLLVVALAFVAAYGVQRFVVKPFRIPSESMESTLQVGDRVLVARFWFRFGHVARGNVIVFHPPGRGDEEIDHASTAAAGVNFIKRVIGLPGDWVGGRRGSVWICAQAPPPSGVPAPGCRALHEPYVSSAQHSFPFLQVPAGRYFVMGDNRDNSDDSRVIGTIPRASIVGRAFVTYWPLERIGGLG